MPENVKDEKHMLEPRPEVGHFEPYLPGRSLEQVKREYKLKRVVKLASNENPLGPSPRVIAALKAGAKNLFRYPDGGSTDLRAALAEHLGVKTTQVMVGAGSDELIEILGKAYLTPADDIVVSEHAFIRYQMAAELMGAAVVRVRMKNHTHDLEAMAKAVTPRTKFVFVANPNNPTGTYNTADELEEFLITLPAKVVPVIDEAYFEYARMEKDYPDSIEFFKAGRNLITLRTFSKIHALAGARVGYGVASEDIVSVVERVRPPFNVSLPAQVAAVAALGDKNQVRRSTKLVAAERKKMQNALTAMGLQWLPSAGNFLLVRVAPRRGKAVFESMLKKGVVIRAMDEYDYPDYFRVTVGLPSENKIFLKALKEVLNAS